MCIFYKYIKKKNPIGAKKIRNLLCPDRALRAYSRPKYLEKLHMMVYTFFFRKELAQNKVNTHFHDLNRIVCRLLTEKTHVQPCFIQM
jgi:hypothetical protein